MSGCSASSSPSLVPFAVQTGAKAPGFSPTAPEFTVETDSPLEEGVSCELVSGNPDFNVRKKRTGVQKPSLISILIRFNDY